MCILVHHGKIFKLDRAHTYIHASINDALNTRAYMYIRLLRGTDGNKTYQERGQSSR